jgi:hypothetical protein
VEVQHHAFLTTALDGGEWLALRFRCLTPGERAPGSSQVGWAPELAWRWRRREEFLIPLGPKAYIDISATSLSSGNCISQSSDLNHIVYLRSGEMCNYIRCKVCSFGMWMVKYSAAYY